MIRITRTDEGAPEERPGAHPNIDEATWQRFEAWCSYRWGVREVTWTVEGEGEFIPPLEPATFVEAKLWTPSGWQVQSLGDGPHGKMLSSGTWQLTYTVGSDRADADVRAAAERYTTYLEGAQGEAGVMSLRDGDYSVSRSVNALARALQYSGAADLLRTYR